MAITSNTYMGTWDRWNYDCTGNSLDDSVWDKWSTSTTSTPGSSSPSSGDVWYTWQHVDSDNSYQVDVDPGKRNGGYTAVWKTWITDTDSLYGWQDNPTRIKLKPQSPEFVGWKEESREKIRAKKAQRTIQIEWNRIRIEEREQEKKEAELTAQELLLDIIGEAELQRYKDTERLFVRGKEHDYVLKKGGGVYRINKKRIIDFVEKKEAIGQFICVHPKRSFNYPETDNVISLKLWIESNEKEFLKIGNLHAGQESITNFDKVVNL
jgi:hypothetical protein